MKARFIPNWGIELVAENKSEWYLLDCFDAQGIRVTGINPGGKSITVCSPEMAGLKQIHLDREQQTILAHSLAVAPFNVELTGTDFEKTLTDLKLRILQDLITPARSVSPPLTPHMIPEQQRVIPMQQVTNERGVSPKRAD